VDSSCKFSNDGFSSVQKELARENVEIIAKLINLGTFVSFARIANCARKVPLFLQFAISLDF